MVKPVQTVDPTDDVTDEEDTTHVSSDDTDPENNPDESIKTEESTTTDKGREDQTGDETVESITEETEETPDDKTDVSEDPRDAVIAQLQTQVAELNKKVNAPPAPTADAPRVRSEHEWADLETKTGLGREGIGYFEDSIQNGLMQLGRVLLRHFNSQMSGSAKNSAIESLSQTKEYADIKHYKNDMDEFLKLFDVTTHGREDLLKIAYTFAKGKNSGKAVKKIINSTEKNKRVATAGRPVPPTSSIAPSKKGKADLKLSSVEREAFNSFGRHSFKTEEDYARSLPRNRGLN